MFGSLKYTKERKGNAKNNDFPFGFWRIMSVLCLVPEKFKRKYKGKKIKRKCEEK